MTISPNYFKECGVSKRKFKQLLKTFLNKQKVRIVLGSEFVNIINRNFINSDGEVDYEQANKHIDKLLKKQRGFLFDMMFIDLYYSWYIYKVNDKYVEYIQRVHSYIKNSEITTLASSFVDYLINEEFFYFTNNPSNMKKPYCLVDRFFHTSDRRKHGKKRP